MDEQGHADGFNPANPSKGVAGYTRMKNVVPEGTIGDHIVRDKRTGLLIDLQVDAITGRRRKRRIPLAYDENGYPVWAYNDKGVPVCGSRRQSVVGKICLSTARSRNGRCRLHGGNYERGIDHQSFRTGLYSMVMTNPIAKDFVAMALDPEYLSLKQNIALLDVQIKQSIEQFKGGLDTYSWDKLMKAKEEAEQTLMLYASGMDKHEVAKEMSRVIAKISILIDNGAKGTRLWEDIAKASTTRAKLVQVEMSRIQTERNSIPADTAYTLFALIMQSVKRHVKDRTVLSAIARDIDQLSANPANRAALGGHLDASTMGSKSDVADVISDHTDDVAPQTIHVPVDEIDIDHLQGVDDDEDFEEDEEDED